MSVLSITVAEPYGRDWEHIYMRHPAPVIDHSSSQLESVRQSHISTVCECECELRIFVIRADPYNKDDFHELKYEDRSIKHCSGGD
jgi:hypothetical protein